MEKPDAIVALSGLAHETRLDIYRLLVEAGPDGMPAGQISDKLSLAPATLSFHLNHLKHAGLIDCERNGRSLIYSADFGQMNALVAYLTENCCHGQPEKCGLPNSEPVAAVARSALTKSPRRDVPSHTRRR